MTKKKPAARPGTIALNKKSRFDFFLETKFEAGIVLEGWEVKSARAGKVQLTESYVLLKDGEAFLIGATITPLLTASSHVDCDPTRTRKLLLNQKELNELFTGTGQKGQTCVCTAMYWKGHLIKVEIALAKGKQAHDKRAQTKEREASIEQRRALANRQRD